MMGSGCLCQRIITSFLGDTVKERKVERVTLLMSCARNQLSLLYTNKIYKQNVSEKYLL